MTDTPDDLVGRLRARCPNDCENGDPACDDCIAADRIEALEAALTDERAFRRFAGELLTREAPKPTDLPPIALLKETSHE